MNRDFFLLVSILLYVHFEQNFALSMLFITLACKDFG